MEGNRHFVKRHELKEGHNANISWVGKHNAGIDGRSPYNLLQLKLGVRKSIYFYEE